MLTRVLQAAQGVMTPRAAEAVSRFLQPGPEDCQDEMLRRTVALKLTQHYPMRELPYCCPETQFLALIVCLTGGWDVRDDAQMHKNVMLDLLFRRLPCGRNFLREWPRRIPTGVPGNARAPASFRRLAREMSPIWVVRPQQLDDLTPFQRLHACVLERA